MNILKIRKNKINVKLIYVLTIVVFFISLLFTIFNIFYQKNNLINELQKKGQLLTEILAHNARIGVFSENTKLIDRINKTILYQKEVVEVSVFNAEGVLLKRNTKYEIVSKQNVCDDPKVLFARFQKLNESNRLLSEDKFDSIQFWSPVISNSAYFEKDFFFVEEHLNHQTSRIIGFVSITLDKAVLHQKIYKLLINCVSIGVICWFVSFPLICFISRKITQPIQQLTENVKKFGEQGKFEYFTSRTNDEIGELAHAFNEMYLALKKREAEAYQLEQRLRHSQKLEAIGSLSRSVAHEFNNILGIIVGYAELVLTEIPCGLSLKDKIHEILKAGQKAKTLMYHLMIFSKKNEKNMKSFQLSILVKETLETLRVCLPASIKIRENIFDDVARVRCNPSQIHQILTNLYNNAIEAMPNGGVLQVSLKKIDIDFDDDEKMKDIYPGEYLHLTVKDTGIGIMPDIEEKIFTPFFTTKKMKDGAGMGLAVVHGIVKSYNGSIKFDSKKGEGTTFTIFLPTVKAEHNPMSQD
jgi:hypothetical protein